MSMGEGVCLLDGQECFLSPGGPNGHCGNCHRAEDWGEWLSKKNIAILPIGCTIAQAVEKIDQLQEARRRESQMVEQIEELNGKNSELLQVEAELEEREKENQELRAQLKMAVSALQEADTEIGELREAVDILRVEHSILPLFRRGRGRMQAIL